MSRAQLKMTKKELQKQGKPIHTQIEKIKINYLI